MIENKVYTCELCKADYKEADHAKYCEVLDTRYLPININMHQEYIQTQKSLITVLETIIKKYGEDNKIEECPVRIEKHVDGIAVVPTRKVESVLDLIIWDHFITTLVNRGTLKDNYYIVDLKNVELFLKAFTNNFTLPSDRSSLVEQDPVEDHSTPVSV